MQTLRLKREGNTVLVSQLNDIDRRVLKAAFRQARLVQERLRLEYAL